MRNSLINSRRPFYYEASYVRLSDTIPTLVQPTPTPNGGNNADTKKKYKGLRRDFHLSFEASAVGRYETLYSE